MQYHLDTIPVWEAMEWQTQCPLCALEKKTEKDEIERTLGSSVMEPDVRVHFNHDGVCRTHQKMLFAEQNRLGHALLMQSHVLERLETLKKLQKQAESNGKIKGKLFSKASDTAPIVARLSELNANCVVCEAIDTHMARYRYTFLHLWKNNADFCAAWKNSKGVCLQHTIELMESAKQFLSTAQQNEFAAEALSFLCTQLENDEQDLAWFAKKFDYRFPDLPWKDSKTATERAINRLRGWCVGSDPYPRKK
ncbi:MAG: DUF6062 family protein [Eubacteriales bacterium]|nr:DUF6062 family protein [Eubacteriales bacterium]